MTNHLSWRYIILLQTRKEIRIFNILLNIFRYWLSLIKINSSRIKHRVLTFIIEADDGGEIQLTFIIEADDGGEIQLMLTRQLRNNLFFFHLFNRRRWSWFKSQFIRSNTSLRVITFQFCSGAAAHVDCWVWMVISPCEKVYALMG